MFSFFVFCCVCFCSFWCFGGCVCVCVCVCVLHEIIQPTFCLCIYLLFFFLCITDYIYVLNISRVWLYTYKHTILLIFLKYYDLFVCLPVCLYVCLSDCCSVVFIGLGDSGRFKNKTDFPTMTRFAYCQCRLRRVFGSLFRRFSWTNIVVIYDVNDAHSDVLGETLREGLHLGGYVPYMLQYYSKQDTNKHMLLELAAANARGWSTTYYDCYPSQLNMPLLILRIYYYCYYHSYCYYYYHNNYYY